MSAYIHCFSMACLGQRQVLMMCCPNSNFEPHIECGYFNRIIRGTVLGLSSSFFEQEILVRGLFGKGGTAVRKSAYAEFPMTRMKPGFRAPACDAARQVLELFWAEHRIQCWSTYLQHSCSLLSDERPFFCAMYHCDRGHGNKQASTNGLIRAPMHHLFPLCFCIPNRS